MAQSLVVPLPALPQKRFQLPVVAIALAVIVLLAIFIVQSRSLRSVVLLVFALAGNWAALFAKAVLRPSRAADAGVVLNARSIRGSTGTRAPDAMTHGSRIGQRLPRNLSRVVHVARLH